MTTLNPDIITSKQRAQRRDTTTRTSSNLANYLSLSTSTWSHTPGCVALQIPLDRIDEVTELLKCQPCASAPPRATSSIGTTLSALLAQFNIHIRDEAPIREVTRGVAQLRRSHIDAKLVEAISARLGVLDEALADFLVEHRLHEPLLAMLQIAAEELASHIAAEQPYRWELVDRQYPEATRLAITIPVRGDVDDIIEAHARISDRLFEMSIGRERLHIGLAFVE